MRPMTASMNLTRPFVLFSFSLIAALSVGEPACAKPSCGQFHLDRTASQSLGQSKHPSRGGCQFRTSNGYLLPDPQCTPGAINPQVTSEMLRNPAFGTKCVRNKTTSETKKKATYTWYGLKRPAHNNGATQVCELDHLVPLELGGADTLDNLWPQCGPADVKLRERYFKKKDLVENYLSSQVRKGRMSLKEAQDGIAQDWTAYLDRAQRCRGKRCK
jgi:hypothetical protein